jgi:hypothetical protein
MFDRIFNYIVSLDATAVQNWLLLFTLITTTCVSLAIYYRTQRITSRIHLNAILLTLQKIAFQYPYLEDRYFISNWDSLKQQYLSQQSSDQDRVKVLQYEGYCEMLFNYLEGTYIFDKKEVSKQTHVAFKPWTRQHKLWWNNPLEKHSNHDTYSKELCDIIDDWLK